MDSKYLLEIYNIKFDSFFFSTSYTLAILIFSMSLDMSSLLTIGYFMACVMEHHYNPSTWEAGVNEIMGSKTGRAMKNGGELGRKREKIWKGKEKEREMQQRNQAKINQNKIP